MAGSRNLLTPSVACKVKSLFDDAVSRFVMFFILKVHKHEIILIFFLT
jgi:hypothetical protein